MADLFSVTAPLAIRFRDSGDKQVMVERLPYAGGLLYLAPFWIDLPMQRALQFVAGPISGDGPWKVGANAIVTVLGCHGTDAELAGAFSAWQTRMAELGDAYPPRADIETLMKTHAAGVAGIDVGRPEFRTRR